MIKNKDYNSVPALFKLLGTWKKKKKRIECILQEKMLYVLIIIGIL